METATQKGQRGSLHWRLRCSAPDGLRQRDVTFQAIRGSFVKKTRLASIDRRRKNAAESARTKGVLDMASAVETMPEDEVRERYHELVDKRPNLSTVERFELERIEARLNAEDFDARQEARNRDWDWQRKELLDSIEDLLDRLRQEQV